MRLAELQDAVQRHVLDGGAPPAALAAAVLPPAGERLGIYAEAYRLRLAEALATQFPALAARAGSEPFAALARAFIAATPSVHRSLRDYGAGLGAWLAAGAADEEQALRAELAEFEWRLAAAFDAAPGAAAGPADLATVAPQDWPALRFRAVPSLQRLATTTPAVAAWRAHRDASGASPAATRGARVEWLIVRPALETQFRSLPGDEAGALDRLLAGASFGELCAELAARAPDPGAAALQAALWLKGWLQEGALERV
ncbi:MAG: putative DNA-binding domain-containing protein [Proteobacteria bacterium]|nr:putative DNA-binding domain-containing protein [Pseudomonadota bacterium]